MPVFPTEAWCRAAIALAEADPEFAPACDGFAGDFAVVMLADASLPQPFCLHLRPEAGRAMNFRLLADPDEADALDAAYLARADYGTWKALLRGELDPVEALLRRKIQVRGDVQPLIERARFRGVIDRVLARLETTFVDEEKR
jgi:putative sterol carrier protein